jgi:hypothetical protein
MYQDRRSRLSRNSSHSESVKGGVMKQIKVFTAGSVRLTALCETPYHVFKF